MGKRKLAATIGSTEHKTTVSRYSNEGLEVHIRGWDHGIMVDVELDNQGLPVFTFHSTGGSNQPKRKELLYVWYPERGLFR